MQMKLTDRTVQSLVPPDQGRLEVFDAKTPGLAIRVSAGGRKAWAAVWHRNGQVRRMTLGTYPAVTLATARERVLQIRAAVARGEDPLAERVERRHAPTVTGLAREYIDRYAKPKKRSWEADQRTLDVDILPVLGTMRASAVERRHIHALLDGIIARGTAARPNRTHANRVRALLHSVFAFGVRNDLLKTNPVHDVERQPERPRDKVLTADEVRAIFASLEDEAVTMRLYVRLLFLTCSRGGELLRLRRENVTFEPEAWLTFPADITKAKREHRVPLTGAAVAVLRELLDQAGMSPWLFPSTKSPRGRRTANQDFYKRLREASGVAFVGHDARRWGATTMAEGGIPLEVVGCVLGHSNQSVTAKHYAKATYANEMRRALELVARQLEVVLRRETPAKVVPLRAS